MALKGFLVGFVIGIMPLWSFSFAGPLYDAKGQVAAPRGSVQQFDYFRQRQLFIDASAMSRNIEEIARQNKMNPCKR